MRLTTALLIALIFRCPVTHRKRPPRITLITAPRCYLIQRLRQAMRPQAMLRPCASAAMPSANGTSHPKKSGKSTLFTEFIPRFERSTENECGLGRS